MILTFDSVKIPDMKPPPELHCCPCCLHRRKVSLQIYGRRAYREVLTVVRTARECSANHLFLALSVPSSNIRVLKCMSTNERLKKANVETEFKQTHSPCLRSCNKTTLTMYTNVWACNGEIDPVLFPFCKSASASTKNGQPRSNFYYPIITIETRQTLPILPRLNAV